MARDIRIEAEYWNKFARLVGQVKWMRELLGNCARVVHSATVYKFMHPKHRISSMTRALRRASGYSGNQAGIASGKLAEKIGKITTRAASDPYHRIPYNHPAVKWVSDGFTVGENYPDYTAYYESGWTQTFTPKQAAFLTYKLNDGEFNFAQWKGLVGKTHSAPERPFNYLTSQELYQAEITTAKTFESFFRKAGEI